MGVGGLAAYISKHCSGTQIDFTREEDAYNLIVDASAIVYAVGESVDWTQGPRYPAFKEKFKLFIHQLLINTNPLFVFDGPLPNYKIPERLARYNDKFEKVAMVVSAVVQGKTESQIQSMASSIMSPFNVQSAIELCRESGVHILVAEGEADDCVARYAILNDCPVLSRDSDFFIYAIPGYISSHSLQFHQMDDSTQQTTAQMFSRGLLAEMFGINPDHMSILAILGGSDHITRNEMNRILSANRNLGIPISNQLKYPKILKFLRGFKTLTFDQAKLKVSRLFSRPSDQQIVLNAIEIAHSQYSCSKPVPVVHSSERDYLFRRMQAGLVNHQVLELYDGKFWCMGPLEDLKMPSCWMASLSIRKHLYSLVCPGQTISEHSRKTALLIKGERFSNPDWASLERIERLEIFLEFTKTTLMISEDLIYYLPSVLAIRNVIIHRSGSSGQYQVGNHEIVAWICSILIKLSDLRENNTPTIASIHSLAQLETSQFSLLLLSQVLIPEVYEENSLLRNGFWDAIDANCFHWCTAQCRRGASPRRIIDGEPEFQIFNRLVKYVHEGLEEHIEKVFDYSGSH